MEFVRVGTESVPCCFFPMLKILKNSCRISKTRVLIFKIEKASFGEAAENLAHIADER